VARQSSLIAHLPGCRYPVKPISLVPARRKAVGYKARKYRAGRSATPQMAAYRPGLCKPRKCATAALQPVEVEWVIRPWLHPALTQLRGSETSNITLTEY